MTPFSPFTFQSRRFVQLGVTQSSGGGGDSSFVERATDPPSITHWWDPKNGSDANDGSSPGNAYLTLSTAVDAAVSASGHVGIVDNTYTTADPGLSSSGYLATYENLNPGYNLFIRGNNEREAIFETNGIGAFNFRNGTGFTLWGVTANSPDGSGTGEGVVSLRESTSLKMIRVLLANVNYTSQQYGFWCNDATSPYFEECEAYGGQRHLYSLQRTDGAHLRRCYSNTLGNYHSGISAYRSNYTLTENCIHEGGAEFTNQCEYFNNTLRGHSQLHVGFIGNGAGSIRPSYVRQSGTHYLNKFKHYLMVGAGREAVRHSAGTDYVRFENGTIYGAGATDNNGPAIDHAPLTYDGTGETAYTNFVGTWPPVNRSLHKNTVIWGGNYGAYREEEDTGWTCIRELEYLCLYQNNGSDSWLGSSLNDNRGRSLTDSALVGNAFSNSLNTNPASGVYGPNFGSGETLVYVPSSHPVLAGAGDGGANIGATILYRYEGSTTSSSYPTETLTNIPLWNPSTGAFPHGAVIAGYNDQDSAGALNANRSLHTLHTRLGISSSTLPAGYGS